MRPAAPQEATLNPSSEQKNEQRARRQVSRGVRPIATTAEQRDRPTADASSTSRYDPKGKAMRSCLTWRPHKIVSALLTSGVALSQLLARRVMNT